MICLFCRSSEYRRSHPAASATARIAASQKERDAIDISTKARPVVTRFVGPKEKSLRPAKSSQLPKVTQGLWKWLEGDQSPSRASSRDLERHAVSRRHLADQIVGENVGVRMSFGLYGCDSFPGIGPSIAINPAQEKISKHLVGLIIAGKALFEVDRALHEDGVGLRTWRKEPIKRSVGTRRFALVEDNHGKRSMRCPVNLAFSALAIGYRAGNCFPDFVGMEGGRCAYAKEHPGQDETHRENQPSPTSPIHIVDDAGPLYFAPPFSGHPPGSSLRSLWQTLKCLNRKSQRIQKLIVVGVGPYPNPGCKVVGNISHRAPVLSYPNRIDRF